MRGGGVGAGGDAASLFFSPLPDFSFAQYAHLGNAEMLAAAEQAAAATAPAAYLGLNRPVGMDALGMPPQDGSAADFLAQGEVGGGGLLQFDAQFGAHGVSDDEMDEDDDDAGSGRSRGRRRTRGLSQSSRESSGSPVSATSGGVAESAAAAAAATQSSSSSSSSAVTKSRGTKRARVRVKDEGKANKNRRKKQMTAEERRRRDRESAKRSRLRKKHEFEKMAETVAKLKAENADLRKRVRMSRIEYLFREQVEIGRELETLLTAGQPDEAQLKALVERMDRNTVNAREALMRDFSLLPVFLDMTHSRNIVLWMMMTPMRPLPDTARSEMGLMSRPSVAGDGPIAAAPTASAPGSSNVLPEQERTAPQNLMGEMVRRIKTQLQEEVGLSEEQLGALVDIRETRFDQIREAFEGNRAIINLLSQLEKQRKRIETYHSLAEELHERFYQQLSTRQRAQTFSWLNRHKNLLRYLVPNVGQSVGDVGSDLSAFMPPTAPSSSSSSSSASAAAAAAAAAAHSNSKKNPKRGTRKSPRKNN